MQPHPHVFENVISKQRLNSYKSYFNVNTDEAIGLYMWNCELSTCFSVLLSFFEIALRNNIHLSMSQFYSYRKSSSIHWYDKDSKLPLKYKNEIETFRHERIKKNLIIRNPAPSPEKIISSVSFGFWSSVLSRVENKYSNQILSKVFPFHPLTKSQGWNITADRKSALEFIYELQRFRNRVAHHEPLWRFSEPASNNLKDSLDRFQRLLEFLDNAMEAMNPDFHKDMLQSSWRRKLDYLLSEQGISRYKNLKHCPDINQQPLTPLQFRKKFKLIMKKNKPIQVGYSNMKGLFIPE